MPSLLNYWILTTEYPPIFGGGISTYCDHTARMLAEKGHRVTVFINQASVRDYNIEAKDGVRIVRFGTTRSGASAFLGHVTNLSYEFAIIVRDFIGMEGKPDCIESQEYLGIAYYLLQFRALCYEWCQGLPVIITAHSPSFLYLEYNHVSTYQYPNFWIGEMERSSFRAADHIISPSHYLVERIQERFDLGEPPVSIVSNPYQISTILNKNEGTQIVFFGKMSAQKGTFKLLQYFRELWENGFKHPLYLIGGGDIVYHPDRAKMGYLVRKKMRKYITAGLLHMEGNIRPSEIAARIASARLVIVPSTVDNFPYVVLEMMTLGKVVLVSKQGGQAELVQHGISGFVFDHNDPASFQQVLHNILTMPDKDLSELGSRAVARVKACCSYNAVYPGKIRILNQVIGRPEKSLRRFPFTRLKSNPATAWPPAEATSTLTVVIPFYNLGGFLTEAIESLQASTYPVTEIIIVNDGSTDAESIRSLGQYRGVKGIRVHDTANAGLAAARNLGAALAVGRYLAFLDADDRVSSNYFDRAVRVLSQYPDIHFVGCWTEYFGASTSTWPTFNPEPPLICYHNLVNSSALVLRRESFLRGGKNDPAMPFIGMEDYESVLSLLSKGFGGVVLPETHFYYRVRRDSMIRDINHEKRLIIMQYIRQKYALFYGIFAVDLFGLLAANGPATDLDNPTLDLDVAAQLPIGSRLSTSIIRLIKKNRIAKSIAYKMYRIINR